MHLQRGNEPAIGQREIEQLCDVVLIINRGCVVAMGSPHQLIGRFECEDLEEVFIYLARLS